MDNLYSRIPDARREEIFESLVATENFTLERIVSHGQSTPAGTWYQERRHEWVLLLSGAAGIKFEDEAETRMMQPGDYVLIPAHRRHRVEWTDPQNPTIWLAVHYR
jgi:cupin 2 domain-containing protein